MARTHEEVKKIFKNHNVSVAEWARRKGFSQSLVYQVLSGKRSPVRGESYQIAIALGLKDEVSSNYEKLSQHLEGGGLK
ncbi:MAG: hypothetical protein OQK12_11585 [Motiliproteus sp.]|nr:hypothetical protein [Motiliproteus sp.]MCW9052148.1 hypothetical protein [Motiliproteus sp.]